MKQVVTRLYPFCVFSAVLVLADTHWPQSVEALSAVGYQQALGAQILDFLAALLEPIDFIR